MAAMFEVFRLSVLADHISDYGLSSLMPRRFWHIDDRVVPQMRRRARELYGLYLALRTQDVHLRQARQLSTEVHWLFQFYLAERQRVERVLDRRFWRALNRRRDEIEQQLVVARQEGDHAMVQELLRAREAQRRHRNELDEALNGEVASDDDGR
jgi:hypothetical protein